MAQLLLSGPIHTHPDYLTVRKKYISCRDVLGPIVMEQYILLLGFTSAKVQSRRSLVGLIFYYLFIKQHKLSNIQI